MAFQEATENRATPKQLRRLFLLLVRSGFPVSIAFEAFYKHMIEDSWKVQHTNVIAQKLHLLRQLQQALAVEGGRSLRDLGIDVPDGFDLTTSELQRLRTKQWLDNRDSDIATVSAAKQMFTPEQRLIFDTIVAACDKDEGAMFDIRGRAGTGKTILLNAICAQARLNSHLTAPSASTGFAALNQTFGLTFHRTFDVPVPDPREDTVLASNLLTGKRAEIMSKTKLCTIDEISSLHIAAFEAAARVDIPNTSPTLPAEMHRHRTATDTGVQGVELFAYKPCVNVFSHHYFFIPHSS